MRFLQIFSGSVVVYALVSCASAITDGVSPSSSLDASVLVDSMASPVEAASAQTASPIVATENCDKTSPFGDSGALSYVYAEHAFAGYDAMQLASIKAIATVDTAYAPPGYTQSTATIFVRDGFAAVSCGFLGEGSSPQFSSVTFVLNPG